MLLGYAYSDWLAFIGFSMLGAFLMILLGSMIVSLIDVAVKVNTKEKSEG